jgi:TonB-dependent SusC/RagA subfamily outer membrane receptor
MAKHVDLIVALAAATLVGSAACTRSPQPPSPAPDEVDVPYGTQPKDKVTGAVTKISEDEVVGSPLRLEELLRGRVAGLQIIEGRNGVTFRIRGTNSMLADQEPLIVVDGIQISSQNLATALTGLTRDDIKSVTVLKDVASTSVYGFRGAGGVILITTKK